MSFIRSHLVIAIVSLFVLTGYGFEVFGECCRHDRAAQTEHGKSAPEQKVPAKGDDCQCVCHQVVSPLATEPVRAVSSAVVPSDFVITPDQFPPDAVPLGIDYPPQLA